MASCVFLSPSSAGGLTEAGFRAGLPALVSRQEPSVHCGKEGVVVSQSPGHFCPSDSVITGNL